MAVILMAALSPLYAAKTKVTNKRDNVEAKLDKLNNIDSQIERQEAIISELNDAIEDLGAKSALLSDSLVILTLQDSLMTQRVAAGLRRRHVERSRISPLAFIAGGASLTEMRQRLLYSDMLQRNRQNNLKELRSHRKKMEVLRAELDSTVRYYNSALKKLETAREILKSRRSEANTLAADLQKETSILLKIMDAKKRRIFQLENELNRMPLSFDPETANQFTGTFEANRGKLLFPVKSNYTIVGTFGKSRHHQLSALDVDNSGIDISVPAGTPANAVFDGAVTSVFFMDGYENIIIVRHGEYLTVYAGLETINVAKGDRVSAGQPLGRIATMKDKTVLHFEVRKERTKLNPLEWLHRK